MLEILLTLPGLCVVALLGMFIHFLKKNVKGETTTEIRDYFRVHFKSTFIASVVTLVSVLVYVESLGTGQMADLLVAFLLGLGFDSTLNNWEKKASGNGSQ